MPLSSLVAFQLYLAHLDWPMMAFGWFIQMYRAAKASEQRVNGFMTIESPLKKESELKRIPFDSAYDFRIENMSLSLPGRATPLFERVNLQLPSAQWIGLAGPVGVGKTVFLELLSRQRDPSKGAIFYRGECLKTKAPLEITQDILYVPQETFLFSRSIRRNLGLGLKEIPSDDLLTQFLEELRFDPEILKARGGVDAALGERGVNLSGGQRQRISLGRALLRKRDVYLFDDLFSHVDAETESCLIQVLKRRLPASALVILVSQRLETLRQCSSILVLNEGGVESLGPSESQIRDSKFLQELSQIQKAMIEDLKWEAWT